MRAMASSNSTSRSRCPRGGRSTATRMATCHLRMLRRPMRPAHTTTMPRVHLGATQGQGPQEGLTSRMAGSMTLSTCSSMDILVLGTSSGRILEIHSTEGAEICLACLLLTPSDADLPRTATDCARQCMQCPASAPCAPAG